MLGLHGLWPVKFAAHQKRFLRSPISLSVVSLNVLAGAAACIDKFCMVHVT